MSPKPISSELEKRRRAIFDRAMRIPEKDRRAFVERESQGDPSMCAAVLRLVSASRVESGGVLDRPVHDRVPAPNEVPRSLGKYRPLRYLGEVEWARSTFAKTSPAEGNRAIS